CVGRSSRVQRLQRQCGRLSCGRTVRRFAAINTLLARGRCGEGSFRRRPPERFFAPLGDLPDRRIHGRLPTRYQRDQSKPLRHRRGRDRVQNPRRSTRVLGELAIVSRVSTVATRGRDGSHANVTLDLRPWTFATLDLRLVLSQGLLRTKVEGLRTSHSRSIIAIVDKCFL